MNNKLFLKLMDSATILRWNDHVCPIQLTELDKQAHKILITYVIAKQEEIINSENVDWELILQILLFEYLRSIALTDIKRPVMSYLVRESRDEIDNFVFEQFEPLLKDFPNTQKQLKNLKNRLQSSPKEEKIIRVSSNIATYWEYLIIAPLNKEIHDTEKILSSLKQYLEDYIDFVAVERYLQKQKPHGFIDLCGQLRFQIRWSQASRLPATSVLGHLGICAILTFLFLNEKEINIKRKINAFWGAAFHDLLEALTRDIISPVKKGIPNIDELIKEYERNELENNLLPLLPPALRSELRFFLSDEFSNKIMDEYGNIKTSISLDDLVNESKNKKTQPYDGKIIKMIDHFAAYLEAIKSINLGIRSEHLITGKKELEKLYYNEKYLDVNFGKLYEDLKAEVD